MTQTTKAKETEKSKASVGEVLESYSSFYQYNLSARISGMYSNLIFQISNSPTGCGLGLFSNFLTGAQINDKEDIIQACKDAIRKRMTSNSFYSLMATLGDTYTGKSPNKEYSMYIKFLEDLGFEEIYRFINKNHGSNYMQRVYSLNRDKLS